MLLFNNICEKEIVLENWNWKRIGIGLGVSALMMLHPVGRSIILFILPLGNGVDDFIAIALVILFIIYMISRSWIKWNKSNTSKFLVRHKNLRIMQIVIAVTSLVFILVNPATSRPLDNWFFYGKGFDALNPDFIIPFVTSIVLAVASWFIIGYIDKKGKLK